MENPAFPAYSLEALIAEVNNCSHASKTFFSRNAQPDSLPLAVFEVLAAIQKLGSATVPQIARHRCTSRQNIQIIVNRLSLERLVETIPNIAHRRSPLVRLTHAGQEVLTDAELRSPIPNLCEGLAQTISSEELQTATGTLQKLRIWLTENSMGPANTAPTPQFQLHRSRIPRSIKPVSKAAKLQQNATPMDEADFPINLL
jgi:DNA-binding MarR family transcriptional regulator